MKRQYKPELVNIRSDMRVLKKKGKIVAERLNYKERVSK